uniref:F-box domain-containing protein n=1 Tax=Mycena chlorophos TaxID=658473 RepID=A0ABQ0KWX3_MYCCL|nr:predicted protein [Mycena chlorophos]
MENAHILTLPPEIIAEIFQAYLPAYPLCPDIFTNDSPVQLSHICSEWRQIALFTPSLWRAIGIYAQPLGGPQTLAKKMRCIETFLERSGSYPLSIRVTGASSPDKQSRETLIDTLLPHRARWQYLVLHGHRSALARITGTFPQLLGAELVASYEIINEQHPLLPQLEAPALHSLSLWHIALTSVPSPHQLTRIYLTNYAPVECVPFLHQCPNLVFLSVTFTDIPRDLYLLLVSLPPQKIHFPQLRTLVLQAPRSLAHVDYDIVERFLVPSVRRLQISAHLLESDPIGKIRALVAQSGCRLDELRVLDPRWEFQRLDRLYEPEGKGLKDIASAYQLESGGFRRAEWAEEALPFGVGPHILS